MKRKNIGYAYAYSDIAIATGHAKTGCYYLGVYDDDKPMKARDVVFSSLEKDAVIVEADHHDMPYGAYSLDLATAN